MKIVSPGQFLIYELLTCAKKFINFNTYLDMQMPLYSVRFITRGQLYRSTVCSFTLQRLLVAEDNFPYSTKLSLYLTIKLHGKMATTAVNSTECVALIWWKRERRGWPVTQDSPCNPPGKYACTLKINKLNHQLAY